MHWLTTVVRILVGGLFIFSGLIKVNDPVGTAIKLEEYFAVFSSNFGTFFGIFEPYALIPFSLFGSTGSGAGGSSIAQLSHEPKPMDNAGNHCIF